jgi:putative alpha-1,2-mannosidase
LSHPSDDDYATYILGKELGKPEEEISFLLERAKRNPFTLWNEKTGFFEARNEDGSWAGEERGWTEGAFFTTVPFVLSLTPKRR